MVQENCIAGECLESKVKPSVLVAILFSVKSSKE